MPGYKRRKLCPKCGIDLAPYEQAPIERRPVKPGLRRLHNEAACREHRQRAART